MQRGTKLHSKAQTMPQQAAAATVKTAQKGVKTQRLACGPHVVQGASDQGAQSMETAQDKSPCTSAT